jgi:hypothetical protein
MNASMASKSAYSTAPRVVDQELTRDRSTAAAALRLTRRTSLLLALALSLGLWTAIGMAIVSLVAAIHG